MSSSQRTVDYILDQASAAGAVRAKKMFGEYGLYCDDIFIGAICDDQLFLKPTAEARALMRSVREAPPYQGAKPHLVIDDEYIDDAELLSQLVAATTAALGDAKPRRRRQ